jgi:endogenous inhibitor of DNA gyrase (YacG/DUF329 family)
MSTAPPASRRIVDCPTCKGPSVFAPDNPFRPFCSRRCKDNDLGAWASETYRVAAPVTRAEDEPEGPSSDPG